jgi:Tfp pilus assembly protein PilV
VQHPGTPRKLREESGFTLIEVLVAATLLIVGVFATLALLDTATKATATSRQRDVANAIGQELVERAQGGRYTAALNDMTDIIPATATPGPADRLRAAMDPDGESSSSAVTPATVTTGTLPTNVTQSWTLRRQNTTYTVSYRACTVSDTYQQVQVQGPYDCSAPTTPPSGTETTSGGCKLGVIPASGVDPANPGQLTVKLQVLGIVGLSVCVGALSQQLSDALCSLLGSSAILGSLTNTLLSTGGLLSSLLGGLGSAAALGLCPASQVDQALAGARTGIASSTRLQVTVGWTDLSGRAQSVAQTAVVRRAAG